MKVRFWHFLKNCHSLNTIISFEYVDFWPKIWFFGTHHWRNFITELTWIEVPRPFSCHGKNQIASENRCMISLQPHHFMPEMKMKMIYNFYFYFSLILLICSREIFSPKTENGKGIPHFTEFLTKTPVFIYVCDDRKRKKISDLSDPLFVKKNTR